MALRQFRLHPTFALITVLVLGLGTGAATVVYTVVDTVVLRYFLLVDEIDLLLKLVGSPLAVPHSSGPTPTARAAA